jgi:hypothetical protein
MVRTVTPAIPAASSGGTNVTVAEHPGHQIRAELHLTSLISSISIVISVRVLFMFNISSGRSLIVGGELPVLTSTPFFAST